MLNSGRIVRLTCNQMLRVRRGEGCVVIYDLVTSVKAEKRKVNVGDAWFRVSTPLSLALSCSVDSYLLLFWSASTVEKFVFYIVFLFWSDQNWAFFGFFFRIGRKITFNYIYFLTNFITFHRHFAMRWSYAQKLFFSFLKKVSALITCSECSRGR